MHFRQYKYLLVRNNIMLLTALVILTCFLFLETSNDLKMYITTDLYTTPTSHSGEHVTIGNLFLYKINVREYMYLTILKSNKI